MRACGECTMCCKLLIINKCDDGPAAFPFDKPAGATCKHCDPGRGCRIFGTPEFPNLCKTYFCSWKLGAVPEECRPDQLHAICHRADPLPEFPNYHILSVVIDPDRGVSKKFMRFLESGADLGLSFVVRNEVEGYGAILSNYPALAKALEERERRK